MIYFRRWVVEWKIGVERWIPVGRYFTSAGAARGLLKFMARYWAGCNEFRMRRR